MYRVNLLPPRLQREGTLDVRRLVFVAGITALAAAMVVWYTAFLFNFLTAKTELAATRQQLASLSPLVKRAEAVAKERRAAEAALKEYEAALGERRTWSDLLMDLTHVTPVDLWLVELELYYRDLGGEKPEPKSDQAPGETKKGENVTGVIPRPNAVLLRGYARTVPSVGVFVNNLQQMSYFKQVEFKKLVAEADGLKFEINATLRDEQ